MTPLDVLSSRRSIPAQCLTGPGPDDEQLKAALDAATRAPDHGRLQPWRFKLIRGAARARFAELLVNAARARDPAATAAELQKFRSRPLQAPLIIAVSVRLRNHPKIPEIEQLMSGGAAAMNLLNAFHAQGFGAIWLTGPSAYDPAVATALGSGSDERLIGFVYAGTIGAVVPTAPVRPPSATFVTEF